MDSFGDSSGSSSAASSAGGAGICLGLVLLGPAVQEPAYAPPVAAASEEGREAAKAFVLAEGLVVEQWAAEPQLANPVCLYVDHGGDVYVGETFRLHEGVTDIREHMDWLDDDLASRTVDDRRRMFQAHLGESYAEWGVHQERVRLLRDTDGDGAADVALVFADGFDDPMAGIGAGLLAREGDVYYACIPDLWLLRDVDGDGRADERRALSSGYGVNVALLGHDLHGLRIGPDGRLYFSCGDRGFHVRTEQGTLAHPHAGAVLRCNLDGSGLEVWHSGLRNPQELAFDDLGNLFTGDNNSDGGDRARWVSVVEGGDSGWRYAYQWITAPVARGPWNDERLWHPAHEGQAAYVLPPVANLADGPSGLTCYPGTGLPESYAGAFFLCDFRGTPRASGIHTVRTLPRGASFELGPVEPFVWGTLATDCDFGPDGRLYFTDWVEGWGQTGKGRVYRAFDPGAVAAPIVAETAALLARGMGALAPAELEELLGHVDRRVRQEAQFELVERGAEGARVLERAAREGGTLLARVHGIWGLGMAGRRASEPLEALLPLAADPDDEVRAQALRVLGDERFPGAADAVLRGLADPAPRALAFAAHAAGRLRLAAAVPALVAALDRPATAADPNLRHALVMGLLGCADPATTERLALAGSPAARTAAVLVLRRRASPALARVLVPAGAPGHDAALVLEAARAVHDVPVPEALPALASLARDPALAESALVRRVLNACSLVGRPEDARALADFALREDAQPPHRREALELLAEWPAPPPRDRVTGEWRPRAERSLSILPELVEHLASGGIASAPAEVAEAFVELAAGAGARAAAPLLAAWVADPARAPATRAAALRGLGRLEAGELAAAVDLAAADPDATLRAAALGELERLAPELVLARVPALLAAGDLPERRACYEILARQPDPRAGALLAAELERLLAGLLPAELALDLVLAAQERSDPALAEALARHRAAQARDPELGPWLDGLFGGDPERGRAVFQRVDLSCQRCHQAGGDGAPLVGPSLEGVGARLARLQMLESIVAPNRRVTPGYEGAVLFLADGATMAGRILEEDGARLALQRSDGTLVEVAAEAVEARRADLSAMPEDLAASLSPREMRDLLAYLGTL